MGFIYGEAAVPLQTGLRAIVSAHNPTSAAQWNLVGSDAERLLYLWAAVQGLGIATAVKSQNQRVATLLVEQFVEFLYELVTPELVVTDAPLTDKIAHVVDRFFDGDSDVSPVPDMSETEVVVLKAEAAEEEEEEETETEEEEEEETAEEEEEAEAEVVEPEEEEEEEEEEGEGMEVEQVTIRGRKYWLETNTKKLYVVVDEDDVGDEVGEMVEGKPRFYSK